MSTALPIDHVRALAACAGLDLTPERLEACAGLLGDWLPPANELSSKMAAPEHQSLMPITVLVHSITNEKSE